jgi:RimJ/RimL family protein N-acetyltransferase
VIETERLVLRPFEDRDRAGFAAMNADPSVMRHFPAMMSRVQSDAMLDRIAARWRDDGFGLAAVERREDGALLGMAGLSVVRLGLPLDGAVEIGWRLVHAAWGHGYASEAARAWLAHGFSVLEVAEVVAFTVPDNLRSQAVMRRIGMSPDPSRDFEHPALPEGHRLRPHVLFARRGPPRRRISSFRRPRDTAILRR